MKKISLIVGVLLLFAGVDLYAQFRIPFRHMNLPKRGAGHFPKGFSSSHFRDMLKREPDAAKVLDLLQQNSNLAHLQDLLQRDIILRKGSFMLKVPYSKQTWRGLQEGHTLLLPAKTAGASLQFDCLNELYEDRADLYYFDRPHHHDLIPGVFAEYAYIIDPKLVEYMTLAYTLC